VLAFIPALAAAGGADPSLIGPNGEIGLVTQKDPEWHDNHGGPIDPQPGNGHGFYDGVDGPVSRRGPEDDRGQRPPQTEQGSTPIGDLGVPHPAAIRIQKAINAPSLGIGPVVTESAPGIGLPNGTSVYWTYEVWNPGSLPLQNVTVNDDAGTPGNTSDDFAPTFIGGDTDNDQILDRGETWRYTSFGLPSHIVTSGQYVNFVLVQGKTVGTGTSVSDKAANYHFGDGTTEPAIHIEKFVSAPSTGIGPDAADTAPGLELPIGAAAVWTYEVTNPGTTPLQNVTVSDDAGTPLNPIDDFSPLFLGGDANGDLALDPGETWRY